MSSICPGKRAASMTEQLALEKRDRIAPQLIATNGSVFRDDR